MKHVIKLGVLLVVPIFLSACLSPYERAQKYKRPKLDTCEDSTSYECYRRLKKLCENLETRNDPRCPGNYTPRIPGEI